MFLVWYDPSPKKPLGVKVAEACERYTERFGGQPAVCLVNPLDRCEAAGVEVRERAQVGRHQFWVGHDDPD